MPSDKSISALAAVAEQQQATFDRGMVSRFNAWFFIAFAGNLRYTALATSQSRRGTR